MAGKIERAIKDVAKVRGEIAVTKMRLAQAEQTEQQLLREVLSLVTADSDEMESLWGRHGGGDFEVALKIDQDVAVVKIEEDYFERSASRIHEAVNIGFIPLAPLGL